MVTALGIDSAEIDGNKPPDYAKAYAAGARFTYLKASQHIFPDNYYARDSKPARAAGLVVGAYHFPGWGPRAAAADVQIAAFRKVLANCLDPRRGVDLPPALDVEGFENCGWTPERCVAFIHELVLEVQDQFGVTPAIYTSYFQWDALGRSAMPWAAACPLFVKTAYRHPACAPYDASPARAPHIGVAADDPREYYRVPPPWDGTGFWFQQHDGDALGFPGFTQTVDVDRFFGLDAPGASAGNTLVSDPRVGWLQGKLGLPADNAYGPVTEAAVRALQARCSLPETGAVDVATFAAAAWL